MTQAPSMENKKVFDPLRPDGGSKECDSKYGEHVTLVARVRIKILSLNSSYGYLNEAEPRARDFPTGAAKKQQDVGQQLLYHVLQKTMSRFVTEKTLKKLQFVYNLQL